MYDLFIFNLLLFFSQGQYDVRVPEPDKSYREASLVLEYRHSVYLCGLSHNNSKRSFNEKVVCAPYGLSVRVNAKDALPYELKYKDWGASGSERINST